MALILEFIIIFATSFGFNMIPFAGPSNLLIASTAAIGLGGADALTLVFVGILIALGASLAKSVHYLVTFYVSGHLGEKRRASLDAKAAKVKRWAFLLLFIAAASPIPDEPIVIPLGLMKYNPVKFFSSYFLGKLTIAVAGALLGGFAMDLFSSYISQEAMIVISIVLTVVITVILLKVDLNETTMKILHKKPKEEDEQKKPNISPDKAVQED